MQQFVLSTKNEYKNKYFLMTIIGLVKLLDLNHITGNRRFSTLFLQFHLPIVLIRWFTGFQF